MHLHFLLRKNVEPIKRLATFLLYDKRIYEIFVVFVDTVDGKLIPELFYNSGVHNTRELRGCLYTDRDFHRKNLNILH